MDVVVCFFLVAIFSTESRITHQVICPLGPCGCFVMCLIMRFMIIVFHPGPVKVIMLMYSGAGLILANSSFLVTNN